MAHRFFITGIGTGVGKTLIAAIITSALKADYWKPVQAGYDSGTDSEWIKSRLPETVVHPEVYKLQRPVSPHIAARDEGNRISVKNICERMPPKSCNLIIEGAGGLMAPLNEQEFVVDLIKALDIKVILVSRNYLGSINHSLLTSELCKQKNIQVAGWVFNDQYLSYEHEIVLWSGIPKIASVPYSENVDDLFIATQAHMIRAQLEAFL